MMARGIARVPANDRQSAAAEGRAPAVVPPERSGVVALPLAGAAMQQLPSRRRLPLRLLSFILVVLLPGAIAGAYYGLVAADQYVVEFRFGLRSVEPVRSDPASLLRGDAGASQIGYDSFALVQYLTSRAAIDDVGKSVEVKAIFTRPEADWLARLRSAASIEEMVAYWKDQIDAFFDPSNGAVVVRVRAFTPQDSLALAQALVRSCERLVNGLSERARRDTLGHSEQDVTTAEHRLTAALARLREFRDAEGIADPEKAAESRLALAARLRAEIAAAATELTTLRNYLQADAPPVRVLTARIRALEAQQRAVEGEVTASNATAAPALSRLMGSYEELEAEKGFAENAYQRALEARDRARAAAERQHVYLALFVGPSLPEEALYPHRWRSTGTVLLIAFAVWAIGGLVVHSVRDHL